MWSYEVVFQHPKRPKKITKRDGVTGIQLQDTSETIVSPSGELALQYALEELKKFDDYELVGIIRRHPIIKIIKDAPAENTDTAVK
jgi:hypothetical protein